MWYWCKVIFTFGWYHYHCSLKEAAKIIQRMTELSTIQKERYVTIEKYDNDSDEYMEALAKVVDNPAWKYFVFDLKSTILGVMEESAIEQGKDYIGILKGIRYLENKIAERVNGKIQI